MIKLFIKCIVILLALQSATDYLRKQKIIEGSIEINYQTVQEKLFAIIPTEKIATGILEFATEKIKDVVAKDDEIQYQVSCDQPKEESPRFKIISHEVHNGETLVELSKRYGVHWRVIQRINHLDTEHKLFVGQKLRIPSKMHQLI